MNASYVRRDAAEGMLRDRLPHLTDHQVRCLVPVALAALDAAQDSSILPRHLLQAAAAVYDEVRGE